MDGRCYVKPMANEWQWSGVGCTAFYRTIARFGRPSALGRHPSVGIQASREIAGILNERGLVSGGGKRFDGGRVRGIARRHRLKGRRSRLRARGLLTLSEVARKLGFCKATVKLKRAAGQLGIACYRLDDMGQYMYQDPEAPADEKSSILTTRAQEA